MTLGINVFVFLCTILIIEQKMFFSDAFLIPPYHYYGFMGGNYFPCNWGYSYCSYLPQDYYYSNGCGCAYDLGGCAPCVLESPSVLEIPSYPGPPFYPEFIIPGSPSITESPRVTTEENDSLGLGEVTSARRSVTAKGNNEEEEEEDNEDYDENGGDYDEEEEDEEDDND